MTRGRAPRRARLIVPAVTVAVVAAVTAGCGGDGDGGSAAPDVTFVRFDGSEASLADYEGTPLVLNFWASWCAPCIRELPAIQEVAGELGGDVAFLGMNVTDDRPAAEAFAAEAGVTYDLAEDPDGELFSELAVAGMPTTFLIDADGEVVSTHVGALEADDLRDAIAEAFPDVAG